MVVGHQAETLKAALARHPGLTFVVQEPQLGTAHALLTTERALAGQTGTLVLLSGDVPLLTAETLKSLVDRHQSTGAAATVVTAIVDDPHGYGRIVRTGEQIARIVEEKDASPAERDDSGDQLRHLRVRARRAVRRGAQHRCRKRAERVLPARSRRDLPAAGHRAWRR